ncbi:MAG: type I DNA topoisomerase, partial [Chloroflexi bacterium]|nr:type I DNA topoisomerase [Chloroflexota bacterium]
PQYIVPREKKRVVKELKEAAKEASSLYLATDPDREGEAISWHLIQAIEPNNKPIHRVVFQEITKDAVEKAFSQPRDIDINLVDAQKARRILDRLVGYKISPLLWKKVKRGLSAGRVQSAVLKMLVDREREIQKFKPEEFWSIDVELSDNPKATKNNKNSSFIASLIGHLGTPKKKIKIHTLNEAEKLISELYVSTYKVMEIQKKTVNRQPAPPFITSTLQQEAWRKLKFDARRTMIIAQQLYEGLSIGKEGHIGLITYMRTDSTRVAHSALTDTRSFIVKKYGAQYEHKTPRIYTKKSKNAQEAHEAIRPTAIDKEPEQLQQYLTRDQLKLYDLIWRRMVASQMSAAIMENTIIDVAANPKSSNGYLFKATSTTTVFPGFLMLYTESKDEEESNDKEKKPLPELSKDQLLGLLDLIKEQHFTQPPPRYTDATIIRALEENGIGRPSTYAPILSLIQDRGYVKKQTGKLFAEEIGMVVSDLLTDYFPNVVDPKFTAEIENKLDEIASGEQKWIPVVAAFYGPLEQAIEHAYEDVEKINTDQPIDEICELCSSPMVIKQGRYGKFKACTAFPKCKNTKPLEEVNKKIDKSEPTDEVCELCNSPMVIKQGRYGKFKACSAFPKCKNTKPIVKLIGVICPKCGGQVIERRSKKGLIFYGCEKYPACTFTSKTKPDS